MNEQKSLPLNQTFSGIFCIIKLRAFFSLEVKSFLLSFGSFHLISEILISSGLMGVVRVFVHLLEGN